MVLLVVHGFRYALMFLFVLEEVIITLDGVGGLGGGGA